MVQGGGVKLVEFEVGHATAGAPGHSNTIAGGDIRIGGVLIDFRRPAGGQHHGFRAAGLNLFFIPVPDPGANHTPCPRQADFIGNDQIDGVTPLQNTNIGVRKRLANQRRFHRFTGGIGSVEDTAMAMAAFTGQVVALFAVGLGLSIKQHTLVDKPLHARSGVAGDERDSMAIAQAGPGDERIFNVRFHAVGFIKNGGNTALRVER